MSTDNNPTTEQLETSPFAECNLPQRTPKPTNLGQAHDELDRLIAQSQALLHTLIGNDQFSCMHPVILSNALWLLSDRLGDIKDSADNMAGMQGVQHG